MFWKCNLLYKGGFRLEVEFYATISGSVAIWHWPIAIYGRWVHDPITVAWCFSHMLRIEGF